MKKIILTVISISLFLHNVFCQEPKQADLDRMMKDAQAMLAKFQQQAKDTSSLKKVSKKYVPVQPVSTVIVIPLKQPIQIPTDAQAKDQLLWYKGKKMNDSMIVTRKGLLVLYKKKQDKVIAQPLEKEDSFRLLVKNISKTAKMTNDYVIKEVEKKNSFMNYPLVQMSVDEFKMIDDWMNSIAKNTIDLTKVDLPVPQKSKGGDGEPGLETMDDLNQMHQQLKQLLSNKPPLNFDPPPKREFSLVYLCDTTARQRYIEACKKWEEGFLAYETELIRKDMQIERSIQLLDIDRNADALLKADMDEALEVGFSRWDEKIKLLTAQYGKDIFRQNCVVTAALQNERTKQLMGISTGRAAIEAIDLFFGPEFENYINDEIGKKNWDVMFNISLLLGRKREAQLLGFNEADERLNRLLERVMKLNRFALTADIDFNIQFTDDDGKPSIKANGKLETADKVYASMYVNRSGCKWTLQLYSPDFATAKETDYYIPMKVTGGIKSVKEDKEWKNYSYSGPTDMLLHFPVFTMDFSAGSGQDSVTLEPLRYLPDAAITNDIIKAYKTDLMSFTNHIFIAVTDEPGNEKNMIDVVNTMMGKFANVTAPPASDEPLEELKNRYLLMEQKKEAEQQTAVASFKPRAVVVFEAANNNAVLIDQSTDTKHKEENIELTKGIIKIKVVHDPVEN